MLILNTMRHSKPKRFAYEYVSQITRYFDSDTGLRTLAGQNILNILTTYYCYNHWYRYNPKILAAAAVMISLEQCPYYTSSASIKHFVLSQPEELVKRAKEAIAFSEKSLQETTLTYLRTIVTNNESASRYYANIIASLLPTPKF